MSSKSLGTLTLDLVAKTGGFVQGMSKAERTSKKWRRSVEKDLKVIGKAFAGASVLAAGGLAALAASGQQFVDSQAKTAARLGSTIDELRAVQIAASDFGIEQGRLTSSLASYTKRLGDAARGTGEAQQAYEALGLEAKELVNLPLPEQLALIAERIADVDSAAERASIADRLMSGGRTMVNLFEDGGQAIRAAVDEVDAFGLSLSQVDAAKVEAANDAMARIPRILEPIKTQLAVALAEPLEGISTHFIEAGKASAGFRDDIHDMVDSTVDGLLFVVDAADGVGRAFELAGSAIAMMVIEARWGVARLALSIYSGPINAINALIEQMNRIPGIELGAVQQFDFVDDLKATVDQFDRAGKIARQDMQDTLMAPMASEGLRAAIEAARASAALELGGDGPGMVNAAAINAAEAVAGALTRAGDAANDSADADEDKAGKSQDAADAVESLAKASNGAASALAGIGGGAGGNVRPATVGEQENGARSVRQRIEAGKDLSAYALEPNPNAKATWSSDYLTNPESDLAARVSAAANLSSVNPQGLAKVQASTQSLSDHAAGQGKRSSVTLVVAGKDGEETAEGEIDDAVLNLLERAAAGSR